MQEVVGDLFTYPGADSIVIPVNWVTRKNGEAVMGAGVAKQAAQRRPWLPASLGNLIRMRPERPTLSGAWVTEIGGIVCLPTKRDWRDPSDLTLIEAGVQQLCEMTDRLDWQVVALPRLGCGHGGLSWERLVRPMLAERLDDRFVVLTPADSERSEG